MLYLYISAFVNLSTYPCGIVEYFLLTSHLKWIIIYPLHYLLNHGINNKKNYRMVRAELLLHLSNFHYPWKKWAGLGPEIPGLKSGPTPALDMYSLQGKGRNTPNAF